MKVFSRFVMAVLILLPAVAGARQRPTQPGFPGPFSRCLEVVGLSEGQKEQVRSIFSSSQLQTLQQQLRMDQQALRDALQAAQPDACTVGGAMLKVAAGESAIVAENASLRTKIEAVLTPDQKLRFSGCMDAFDRPRDGGR